MICKTCRIDKGDDFFRKNNLTCRKCNNIKNKISQEKYRQTKKYKERMKSYRADPNYKKTHSYIRNKKAQSKKSSIRDRETLHRRYIYKLLYNSGFRAEDITNDLIEVKTLLIKMKRYEKHNRIKG